jgi:hypothetical protein
MATKSSFFNPQDMELVERETLTVDNYSATLVCNDGGRGALLLIVLIIINFWQLIPAGLLLAAKKLVALVDGMLHVKALVLLERRGHLVGNVGAMIVMISKLIPGLYCRCPVMDVIGCQAGPRWRARLSGNGGRVGP